VSELTDKMAGKAEHFRAKAHERGIPDYMVDGLVLYLTRGVPPGGFLTAVLNNDFLGAIGKADARNRESLYAYAVFLVCDAPIGSHGRSGIVSEWIKEFREAA
jgi:hypothetical protein